MYTLATLALAAQCLLANPVFGRAPVALSHTAGHNITSGQPTPTSDLGDPGPVTFVGPSTTIVLQGTELPKRSVPSYHSERFLFKGSYWYCHFPGKGGQTPGPGPEPGGPQQPNEPPNGSDPGFPEPSQPSEPQPSQPAPPTDPNDPFPQEPFPEPSGQPFPEPSGEPFPEPSEEPFPEPSGEPFPEPSGEPFPEPSGPSEPSTPGATTPGPNPTRGPGLPRKYRRATNPVPTSSPDPEQAMARVEFEKRFLRKKEKFTIVGPGEARQVITCTRLFGRWNPGRPDRPDAPGRRRYPGHGRPLAPKPHY